MNILECSELFQHPLLYGTFLLWMLSELYELLPEVGDLDKPKIAFFFDEAHLLFKDAPRALLDKVEQVVRLIRSKGVSVWFISQNPSDIPESVLGQIGNRVQHALRAYTPNEQKALRYAARSFRVNPEFDTETVLQQLETGQALVSVLDPKGVPTIVERAGILPPRSSMNIADESVVRSVIEASPLRLKYDQMIDRISAFETLTAQAEAQEAEEETQETSGQSAGKPQNMTEQFKEQKAREKAQREQGKTQKDQKPEAEKPKKSTRKKQSAASKTAGKVVSSAANTVGREIGRGFVRGLLGILKR